MKRPVAGSRRQAQIDLPFSPREKILRLLVLFSTLVWEIGGNGPVGEEESQESVHEKEGEAV